MKAPFWIGIAVLVTGIVSLVVPFPHNQRGGFNAGVPVGVETRHEDKVSPFVSAVMILGGAGTMVAGKKKS
jgi:hypothetical protein